MKSIKGNFAAIGKFTKRIAYVLLPPLVTYGIVRLGISLSSIKIDYLKSPIDDCLSQKEKAEIKKELKAVTLNCSGRELHVVVLKDCNAIFNDSCIFNSTNTDESIFL